MNACVSICERSRYHRVISLTASHLYAYATCPHRVWRDAHDDESEKDPVNEFVQLLWEKGTQHEHRVIAAHCDRLQLTDLSAIPKSRRAAATMEAIRNREPYIY